MSDDSRVYNHSVSISKTYQLTFKYNIKKNTLERRHLNE